jgi:hypothetical protein
VRRAVREGRKVLYVGHKDLEPFLVKHGIPKTDVAHWGEIDGSNAWRDFDAVAILTIFYRPDWWAPNTIFALNGEVDPEVLGPEGDALRWKLMRGQLVSDIVQAIGRVRCRKVVDAEGNCRATDVFLKLPSGARGEELLRGIVDELPGVRVVEWAYEGTATKSKVPASQVAEALVLWCSRLPQGRTSSKRAREELRIAAITWKRLVVALKDPVSDISKRLAELGIGFFAGVKGSHQAVAAFVRA